ncbi:seryl-tRNA synthetase [Rhodomicrobium vannielii ATCC 17100]|uniref:Serine--tRNA ligase n=1 Tax=Rhodomicrobium vannielii (strain ATCC 17100 / DSM 162 / LMG 4299 / NCIMB 10020 / ATH 3.1.1) TaxID=648757 RepID=E3I7X7_RHOVT|nr:serine--tRNA ligase [Rhodomicrobium vannielii]ADP70831.1 seryl-tRNA synthetase [Rhodomicrobium vannielii ATCC 17100]
MLDLKWIRENPADFDQGLARRGTEPLSSKVLALDEELRAHKKALQDLQARRNAASKEIGKAKGKGGDPAKAEALMAEVADLKGAIAAGEAKERELDAAITALLAGIPNMLLPAPEVPDGKDESENVELRRVGTPRDFAAEDFAPKQHFELGEALGLMDFEAAAKISGARFTVLKGKLARLERALGQFMLDVQTSEHGYTEVNPPLLVRDRALYGTAQLPKFEDDLYKTAGTTSLGDAVGAFADEVDVRRNEKTGRQEAFELYWLIPTAEVPLTNLVRESILPEADLPLRFTALTPCFRAEAGAAGRDTRGMIRQHQFYKVEMVSITTPDASAAEHERMTSCAEEILKRLGLPYRVVVLCAGDTGFGARKTHDIEVWLPGQGAYREISSVSNCGDFQARRMQARFRPSAAKDLQFVHTLNGSGLAVGRALIAVIENYQEADGSIRVPDALLPYMGGVTRIGA